MDDPALIQRISEVETGLTERISQSDETLARRFDELTNRLQKAEDEAAKASDALSRAEERIKVIEKQPAVAPPVRFPREDVERVFLANANEDNDEAREIGKLMTERKALMEEKPKEAQRQNKVAARLMSIASELRAYGINV